MGIFNFFKTSIVLAAVNKIEAGIKNSKSYKYFSKDDTSMIKEYKDFECSLIASAIAVIALDLNLQDANQKKDIQTVYIEKSSSFLRKLISKKYKCHSIELSNRNDRDLVEKLLVLKIHVRFNQYLEDIKKAFKQKSAFYFLEYEKPVIEEWTDEVIYGQKRGFEFVLNLLLAEETLHWDIDWDNHAENEKYWIGYKGLSELAEEEKQLMDSFVKEIELLQVN